ncbi:hypothetical protein MKW94_009198 [Papaver nudicaule]|uniref:C2H2-type domain-containing protein n=1 Tax=Papaver nudicaule TaxID=74823 RepID=A0AA41SEP4_PAPNU|nr:hypothetical protein [Papaver nudicaule]
MEIQEDNMILNMGSNDISYIAKGKRTKRQRLQSPIVLALTNTTTSNSTSDDDGGNVENGDDNNQIIMNNSSVSPTSSTTTGFVTSQEDQEDEDMANCLILLAKGGHGNNKRSIQHQEEEEEEVDIIVPAATTENKLMEVAVPRFNNSSRRITEAPIIIGKSGFYVYECKTCNRCFPSFQALGGHRASHKKPKNLLMLEDHQQQQLKKSLVLLSETQVPVSRPTTTTSSSMGFNNNKSKVHECSICGAEFSSGQALGGHMRRHRTTPITAAATTTTNSSAISAIINQTTAKNTITSMSGTEEFHHPKMQKTRNLLSLDLNLPAPQEDDQQGKFTFGSSSKQQSLVFSASPLVDCHY